MADTFTTNLNLTKPEVGASTDTWGTKINADLDALDAIFAVAGTAVNVKFASANFDDNAKAIFGTGDDLEIYHDGSNSYIKDGGTGDLRIASNDLYIKNGADTETKAYFLDNGAVGLYYDDAVKFATTSSGATVTGTLVATLATAAQPNITSVGTLTGLTVEPTTAVGLTYAADGTNSFINFEANSVAASVQLYAGQSSGGYLAIGAKDSGGTLSERMRVTSTGVGIGTSSPANYSNYTTLNLGQGGTGSILQLDGSTSGHYHLVQNNNGAMIISADQGNAVGSTTMNFLTDGSERMRIASDGSVVVNNSGGDAQIYLGGTSGTSRMYLARSVNDSLLWNVSNGNLRFGTNNAERMRIDSSGRLMINATAVSAASAGVNMQVNSDILSRGSIAGYFWENRSGITIAGQTGWGGWYSTGTSVHSLYSDGANIVSINRSSGAYTALSDVNKKKDFEDSTVGLAEVMQLQPKKFRMLDDADDAPKKLGFVAQDVENVIPEAYVEDTNEDASGVENTFIGLTDRPIIAALTKAIQEQQTQIDALQSEINLLKGE